MTQSERFAGYLKEKKVPLWDSQAFFEWLENGPLNPSCSFDESRMRMTVTTDHCGCGCEDHITTTEYAVVVGEVGRDN